MPSPVLLKRLQGMAFCITRINSLSPITPGVIKDFILEKRHAAVVSWRKRTSRQAQRAVMNARLKLDRSAECLELGPRSCTFKEEISVSFHETPNYHN